MKLQFRLRTLMIVVTLLAVPLGYVGWQAKIVRERKAFREAERGVSVSPVDTPWTSDLLPVEVSHFRLALGDKTMGRGIIWRNATDEDVRVAKELFPEVVVWSDLRLTAEQLGRLNRMRGGFTATHDRR